MLQAPGKGFVCGKLGAPTSKAEFISSTTIPHVMMVAPTRAGKGVGFVIPNLLSFAGSVVVLDVKGENFEKTARLRALNGDEVYRFSPFDWANATHRYNPLAGSPRPRASRSASPRSRSWPISSSTRTTRHSTPFPRPASRSLSRPACWRSSAARRTLAR
nr:type IV secretory system conjugative DNA transfer family protein [Ruegeria sp. SCSIO 43209]